MTNKQELVLYNSRNALTSWQQLCVIHDACCCPGNEDCHAFLCTPDRQASISRNEGRQAGTSHLLIACGTIIAGRKAVGAQHV